MSSRRSTNASSAAVPKRPPGRPPRISLDDIVDAAVQIGLRNLTLTGVADRLGVSPAALYYYVNDREELLDLVAEELSKRSSSPEQTDEDWFAWARHAAISLRDMLRSAPGLAERALANMHTTPGILERYETSMEIATASGFDDRSGYWATRAVFEFVQAWVLREERLVEVWGGADSYRRALVGAAKSHENDLPTLTRALSARQGARREDDRFIFTLESLLHGLGHLDRS